jgi:3-phenylpropionate/trans-cinnamate dioxygenase ferredoxin component
VTFFDAMPTDWIDPGETAALEVDDWPVGIANIGNEFFGFQALCPHQGTRLAGLPLDGGCFVTCPHHSSRYDVRTGECVKPASDGFNQDLLTYQTRVVDDVVQVEL